MGQGVVQITAPQARSAEWVLEGSGGEAPQEGLAFLV